MATQTVGLTTAYAASNILTRASNTMAIHYTVTWPSADAGDLVVEARADATSGAFGEVYRWKMAIDEGRAFTLPGFEAVRLQMKLDSGTGNATVDSALINVSAP